MKLLNASLRKDQPQSGAILTSLGAENGLISIIVTIIIMFLLSITIMSFATITRREQRQVLDRQLNTQAFYGAESGINDAIAKLKELSQSDPGNVLRSSYTTSCKGFQDAIHAAGGPDLVPSVTADSNVSYSCLLLDPRPDTLEYKSVDRNPLVIPINSGDPLRPINTITFNWQASSGAASFNCPGPASIPNLSTNAAWTCATGLLRIDLVQTPTAGFTRDVLNANQRTLFLYPGSGAGTFSLNPLPAQTGQIVAASCTATPPPNKKFCTVTVTVPAAQSYYLKMSSIYQPSSVALSATSGGSPVALVGAQAMIDSTGKANDILRRLQVRVSINPLGDGPFPIGAIQSVNTLCKQYSVIPAPINTVTPGSGDPDCAIN